MVSNALVSKITRFMVKKKYMILTLFFASMMSFMMQFVSQIVTYMTPMHFLSKANLKNMQIQILMISHTNMVCSMGLWLRPIMANLVKVKVL